MDRAPQISPLCLLPRLARPCHTKENKTLSTLSGNETPFRPPAAAAAAAAPARLALPTAKKTHTLLSPVSPAPPPKARSLSYLGSVPPS